ncbi:MAG: queuosine salvage family protein [Myxococcota bacterium]
MTTPLTERCVQVAAQARSVTLNEDKLAELAAGAPAELLTTPTWHESVGDFDGHADAVITWLVTYNAINFSYFPDPGQPRWFASVGGERVGEDDEALAVMAIIGRALKNGVPFGDWSWLKTIDADDLAPLLAPARTAGPLPLFEQRLAALQELGEGRRLYAGPPSLYTRAQGSAQAFVDRLIEVAPSWSDVRTYEGVTLPFHKRAWLCAAMLYGRFQDDPIRRFTDPEVIPVFADYRLPQILRGAGAMVLSEDLAERIDGGALIVAGSPEEIELRAGTVAAAVKLQAMLGERLGTAPMLLQIDHFLWRTAVRAQADLPPFHRTRTTDY